MASSRAASSAARPRSAARPSRTESASQSRKTCASGTAEVASSMSRAVTVFPAYRQSLSISPASPCISPPQRETSSRISSVPMRVPSPLQRERIQAASSSGGAGVNSASSPAAVIAACSFVRASGLHSRTS